jgi:pimeloyl-ACP methyl ester carboxylesterase
MVGIERCTASLHGDDLTYRVAGTDGAVIVLLHGVAGCSNTWEPVMERLAVAARVVAPDLLGHGESAKPRGDYSLGAYASGLRDLLTLLGHDRVTLVGHSLGGGVAMQFAYQYPERVARLALVASGGLGPDISGWLRAASLPGAELVLPVIAHRRVRDAGSTISRFLGRFGLQPSPAVEEIARSFATLADGQSRAAFLATLRSVVDPAGQRVSALEKLYLAADVPTLLVWGSRDPVIPLAHGQAAYARISGSRLEVLDGAGHYPHRDDPARFARILLDFVSSTKPAKLRPADLARRLLPAAV